MSGRCPGDVREVSGRCPGGVRFTQADFRQAWLKQAGLNAPSPDRAKRAKNFTAHTFKRNFKPKAIQ